jgi:hypothetical protein
MTQKLPADADDDNLPVEMAAFDEIVHARPSGAHPRKAILREYAAALAASARTLPHGRGRGAA